MTTPNDTLQIILIVATIILGSWALLNSKEPVKDQYHNERHEQVQFDSGTNKGCLIGLFVIFFGACGVAQGLYWLFQSLAR